MWYLIAMWMAGSIIVGVLAARALYRLDERIWEQTTDTGGDRAHTCPKGDKSPKGDKYPKGHRGEETMIKYVARDELDALEGTGSRLIMFLDEHGCRTWADYLRYNGGAIAVEITVVPEVGEDSPKGDKSPKGYKSPKGHESRG